MSKDFLARELQEHTLLGQLTTDELQLLDLFLLPRAFDSGDCIFRQGEEGDGCYIIKQGSVRVEIERPSADEREVIGLLGPGRLVGEMCLCGLPVRSAYVFAETPVELQWLSTEKFSELGEVYPSLALSFSRIVNQDMARKIQQSNTRLMDFISIDNSPKDTAAILQKAASQRSIFTSPDIASLLSDAPTDVELIDLIRMKGVDTFCLVADSVFATMDQYITDLADQGKVNRWVMPSERSVPAVAVGRWLATGKLTAMSMQNSGLSNAMDYLRTVMIVHGIPGFLMSSWRGFDAILDDSEPHILIGEMTEADSVTTFGEHHVFGYRSGADMLTQTTDALHDALNGNVSCIRISPPGFVKSYRLRNVEKNRINLLDPVRYTAMIAGKGRSFNHVMASPVCTREDALRMIVDEMKELDPFYIVGNGFNPRAMQALRLTENTFENAGGMGSTLAIAWGAAKSDPDRVFVAIEGDQNAIMNEMEKVLSFDYPPNLYWYILNNGTGESVGPSVSLPLSPWHYDLARIINTSTIDPGTFSYDRINASGMKFDPAPAKELAAKIGNLPAQAHLARQILARHKKKQQ